MTEDHSSDAYYVPDEENVPSQASFVGDAIISNQVIEAALRDRKCYCVSQVLVFYTGGTIGMKTVRGSYAAVPHYFLNALSEASTFSDPKFEQLIEMHKVDLTTDHSIEHVQKMKLDEKVDRIRTFSLPISKEGRRILYTVVEYDPLLDSSDLSMNEWVKIARDIYSYYDHFDGFVILHGTDTLSYTAAALSFMCEHLGKPIVLTGAQVPVFELRSDGWNNFLGALLIAGGGYAIPEVTVFFHDKLFRGCRVVKCSSNEFDAFDSPNYPALVDFGTEIRVHSHLIYRTLGIQKAFTVHTKLSSDVAVLNIFPLIPIEHVKSILAPPTKGVVIRTYGVGNVPASRQDFLDQLKMASDRGVLMINVTQCSRGPVKAIYSTGVILNEYGVIPGYDTTTEAAIMKLAYVLSKTENADIITKRSMLINSLRGEVTIEAEDSRAARLSTHTSQYFDRDKSLVSYFAMIFRDASIEDTDNVGTMWARRLTPNLACAAAASNNISYLQELFDLLGDLQVADSDGCTPLHKSCYYGHIEATNYLLEKGLSVHCRNKQGLTALNSALEGLSPSEYLIKLLLNANAKLRNTDKFVTRSVHRAIEKGDLDQLRLYLKCKYDFQTLDHEGRSALHVAVSHRKLEVLRFLISPYPSPRKLSVALTRASNKSDRLYTKQFALSMETDSSEKSNYTLFDYGAGLDLSLLTSWGTSALDEAKLRNFHEIIDFLTHFSTDTSN